MSRTALAIKKISKINSKTCLLILFYIKILPTPTFVEQVFFQKLPVFDSSSAKSFRHFANFTNFSYIDYYKIFTNLKSTVTKL